MISRRDVKLALLVLTLFIGVWLIGYAALALRDAQPPAPAHPARSLAGVSATVSTAYDLDVVAEVVAEAERLSLPPELLLAVAFQEGGLVRALWPAAVGDLDRSPTGSCGPFQIYTAVHGGPCTKWFDVGVSVRQMEARWRWAFDRLGGWRAWEAHPAGFLRDYAPLSQGSLGWSLTLAENNLALAQTAYAAYQQSVAVTPCAIADALRQLAAEQLGVAGALDETAFLAGVGRIQSAGHPVGNGYATLERRMQGHRDAVRGLAEAYQYEAGLLCPSPAQARLPLDAPLTQAFGVTPFVLANPGVYAGGIHTGLDFAAAEATAVRAVRGGTVTFAGWRNVQGRPVNDGTGFGLAVAVTDGTDTWWYAHLSHLFVTAGERVTQGQNLALSGSSGYATGPHLHLEVRRLGVAVDPLPLLGWTPARAAQEQAPHD